MKGEGTRVFTKRGKLKKETKPKKEKKKPKGVGPRTIIKKEVIELPRNEVIEVPKPRGRPRKEPAFVPFVFKPPKPPKETKTFKFSPDLFRGEPEEKTQTRTQRKPGDPFKPNQFEFVKDRTARLGKLLGDKFRDAIADFKALPKAEKRAKLEKMATYKTSYITPEQVDKAKTVSSLEALYLQNLVGVQQYQEGQQLGVPIRTLEAVELGVEKPPPKTKRSKSLERAEPKPKQAANPLDLADQPKKRGRPKKEAEPKKTPPPLPPRKKKQQDISVSSEPLAPLILPQDLQPKKLTPKFLKSPPTSPERKEELKKERSPKKPETPPVPKYLKPKVTPVEAEKEKLLEELKAEVQPKLRPKVKKVQSLDKKDEKEHDEDARHFAELQSATATYSPRELDRLFSQSKSRTSVSRARSTARVKDPELERLKSVSRPVDNLPLTKDERELISIMRDIVLEIEKRDKEETTKKEKEAEEEALKYIQLVAASIEQKKKITQAAQKKIGSLMVKAKLQFEEEARFKRATEEYNASITAQKLVRGKQTRAQLAQVKEERAETQQSLAELGQKAKQAEQEKREADARLKEAQLKAAQAERGKKLAAAKAVRIAKAEAKAAEEKAKQAEEAEAYRKLEERRQLIREGAATTLTSKLKAVKEGQETRAKLAKTQEERESAFGDLQLKVLQAKAKEAGKEATKEKLKQSIEERQSGVRQSREARQSKEPTLKPEPKIKAKANVAEAQRKAQEDRKKWDAQIKEKHEKAKQAKAEEKAERERLKGVRSKAATEARQRAKDIKLAAVEEERQIEEAAIEAERLRRIDLDLLVAAEELRQAEEKRVANEALEAKLKAEEQEGEESEKEGAKKTVAPRGRKVTKEETEARARRKKSLEDKEKQAQARLFAAQEAEREENEKLREEIEARIAKREKGPLPITEKDKEKMRSPDYLDYYKEKKAKEAARAAETPEEKAARRKEQRRKDDEEYEARLKEEKAMKKAQANQAEIKSLVKARKPATEPSEEELAAKEKYEAEQKSAEKLAKAKLAKAKAAKAAKEEDYEEVVIESKNYLLKGDDIYNMKREKVGILRDGKAVFNEQLEREKKETEKEAIAKKEKKEADEKRKEAIAETEEETRQRQFRLATGSVDELYESDFKPYFEALGINSLEEFKQLKRPLRDEILSLTRQELRGRVGKRDVDILEQLEQKIAKSKAKKAPKEKSEEEQAQEKQEAIKRLAEVRQKKQSQQTLLQKALAMEREAEARALPASAEESAAPTVSKSSIREKLLRVAGIPRSSYAADRKFKKEIDQEVERIASLSGELSKHQIEFNKERAAQLGDKYRALKDLEETGSVVSIGAESTESSRAPKQKGARQIKQEQSRLNALSEAADYIPREPLGPESPRVKGEGLPYGRAKGMGDLSDGDVESQDGGGSDQEEKLSHYTYIMPSSPILRRGFRHPAMASPGMSDHLHPNAAANIHAFSGGLLRTQPTDARYRRSISRSRSPSPDDMRGMGMSGCGKSLKEKMEKVYHKAVPKSLRPAVEDLGEAAVDYAVNSKKVKAKRRDVRDDYNKAVPQSFKEPIKDLAVASGKYAKRQSGFGLKKGSEAARKFMAELRSRRGKKMKGGKIPEPPSRSPITDPSLL